MKFQTAINKCVKGDNISNDNMKKSYLEYDKSEERIKWWDSTDGCAWSYPEDKNSTEFIKELNLDWYVCNKNGDAILGQQEVKD